MHHTKVKGDIGLTKVMADLTFKGYIPCIPLSELKSDGTVDVRFRRCWADRNGTHISRYSKDEFDYYALYCPERDVVMYVPNSEDCPKVIRFEKTANNQSLQVKWYNDYLKLGRESSETIRCTPEMVKT